MTWLFKFNRKKLLWQVPFILLNAFFAVQIFLFAILSHKSMKSRPIPKYFPAREQILTSPCYVKFPSPDGHEFYAIWPGLEPETYFVDYNNDIYHRNQLGVSGNAYGGFWIGKILITAEGDEDFNWLYIGIFYSPLRLATGFMLPTFHAEKLLLRDQYSHCPD